MFVCLFTRRHTAALKVFAHVSNMFDLELDHSGDLSDEQLVDLPYMGPCLGWWSQPAFFAAPCFSRFQHCMTLGGTDEVGLPDILLGWCSALYLLWNHLDPPGDGFVFCALFAVSVVGCMLGYSS